MADFLNKLVSIVLIFIMVLMTLVWNYTARDWSDRREVVQDVNLFLDKVIDKGSIEDEDLNQLYLDVNSHSMILNAVVKRMVRGSIRVPDESGVFITKTTYFAVEDLKVLNPGDVVQVQIEEIGVSTVRELTYQVLKIDNGPFKYTVAGGVK